MYIFIIHNLFLFQIEKLIRGGDRKTFFLTYRLFLSPSSLVLYIARLVVLFFTFTHKYLQVFLIIFFFRYEYDRILKYTLQSTENEQSLLFGNANEKHDDNLREDYKEDEENILSFLDSWVNNHIDDYVDGSNIFIF